jgi:hypothetical protein
VTTDEIALFGAIATSIGSLATIGGVITVWRQIAGARKSFDASSLFEINREQRLLVREFSYASEDDKRRCFLDLANFLEVLSASLNRRLLPATAHEIATDMLCGFLVDIEAEQKWWSLLSDAVDAQSTFKHVHLFMKRNRAALKSVRAAHASLTAGAESVAN